MMARPSHHSPLRRLLQGLAVAAALYIAGYLAVMLVEHRGDLNATQTTLGRQLQSYALLHADYLPIAALGGHLFDNHCASCHDDPAQRAPSRQALSQMALESIMVTLEFGKMQPMAAHLSKLQKGLIAFHLSGDDSASYHWLQQARCSAAASSTGALPPVVGSWGGEHNQRNSVSQIHSGNVAQLQLAWSMALPRVADMRSQPAVIGDTLYLGDKTGRLWALDRYSGCVRNTIKLASGIRSAITVQESEQGQQLILADSLATVYAIDPTSLAINWQRPVGNSAYSVISGSISAHQQRLYVPISSYEVAAAGQPGHYCCTSHGGVAALDARNGELLWSWQSTAEATQRSLTPAGIAQIGPSGASIWSTPTIDAKRNRLYVGSGENFSHPATATSDAILALDLDSGELLWHFQALAEDVWNAACLTAGGNCPADAGPDFDFGASVIIASDSLGRERLYAGQKSGHIYALDPDADGALLWQQRIGSGTSNGGIHWGMAAAAGQLFVPLADPERPQRRDYRPQPGLYAVDIDSGELRWSVRAERGCQFDPEQRPLVGLAATASGAPRDISRDYACSYYHGHSAAVTATNDLVFSARLNGEIGAYRHSDGQRLWQQRTALAHQASNGIGGHGGAIDVGGQIVVDEWLYVSSGYGMFGQLPGNLLLAYKLADTTAPEITP